MICFKAWLCRITNVFSPSLSSPPSLDKYIIYRAIKLLQDGLKTAIRRAFSCHLPVCYCVQVGQLSNYIPQLSETVTSILSCFAFTVDMFPQIATFLQFNCSIAMFVTFHNNSTSPSRSTYVALLKGNSCLSQINPILGPGGGRFAPTITFLRLRVCVCVYTC